jgi:pyridoxal phosphate enzyme (YggS family)
VIGGRKGASGMDLQADQLRAALARSLAGVRERIARAAEGAGRGAGEVRLVAVTKTVPAEVAAALVALGVQDLGENRVQDLVEKQAALRRAGAPARFHMIGHLQRNKARAALDAGAFLHALDGERLAEAVEDEIEKQHGRGATGAGPGAAAACMPAPLDCFVEVNVSGEASKGGLAPAEVEAFLARREARRLLRPTGLMTMAPLADAGDRARPHFARLRALRDALRMRFPALAALSMGMTQDFEAAIAEGATHVRIGSALFEGLR